MFNDRLPSSREVAGQKYATSPALQSITGSIPISKCMCKIHIHTVWKSRIRLLGDSRRVQSIRRVSTGVVIPCSLSRSQHGPQASEEQVGTAGQASEALRRRAVSRAGRHPGAGRPPCLAARLSSIVVVYGSFTSMLAAAAQGRLALDTTLLRH